MDWNLAIERNTEALKRILAALVAMAALPVLRACGDAAGAPTLPRHLHRAVLRLLRPAESAARRLVIVAARGLVVTLPPLRPRKPKPAPTILRNGVGTGILMPRGVFAPPPLTPPHKGEGDSAAFALDAFAAGPCATRTPPSPLWGGVRGGGKGARRLGFQLFDPPRRTVLQRPVANSVPRISFPGYTDRSPVAERQPPSPGDPINAARLYLRLAALASALDDLPAQAKRFARWRARKADAQNRDQRDRGPRNTSSRRRVWPLRFGRPPGQRPARNSRRPLHEVHDVLKDLHGLAFDVLERRDTS